MCPETATLIVLLSAPLSGGLLAGAGAEFEAVVVAHQGQLAPVHHATRADDGGLFVTVTCPDADCAIRLQAELEDMPEVLSVYRKPDVGLP